MKKFIFLTLLFPYFVGAQSQAKLDDQLRKLFIATSAISELYVDTINNTQLTENAIIGMLKELDPHSSYTNAVETKKFTEPLKGNFDGIGVQFNVIDDTLIVNQPITGGPSEKVGIIAGDRIIMEIGRAHV